MARMLVTPRSVTSPGHPALDDLRAAGHEVVFCSAGRQPTEEELVGQSDSISLHCPPPADGTPVIDQQKLQGMTRGVYLLNTARHELVDAAALEEQSESGQVAGAALDVFDTEPPIDDALACDGRVIATPHLGGYTNQSVDRAAQTAVDNLLGALGELQSTGIGQD